ncbi:MAG: hypothetical protein M5U12_19150 [Verrucomicrobia bacterium]|nr:hypothetical protein [Verrucomicrobiota bacterium]
MTVTDNGTPPRSASRSFRVTVNEIDNPRCLSPSASKASRN